MGENRPTVSVIIPTYNRVDCISKTIDSVLAQTYKNYEIIVADDGSTDNTKQVLEPYFGDKRIRYIYQENSGCAAARNAGIRASCGEWIAFLDSDDRWMPEYLEWQLKCIEYLNVNVSITNILRDVKDSVNVSAESNDTFNVENDCELVEDPLDITLVHNPMPVTLQGMIIQKELIKKLGGFDETVFWASDRRFILRVATHVPFGYINRKVVIIDRIPGRKRLTEGRDFKAKEAVNSSHVLNYSEVYFRCRKQKRSNIRKSRRVLGQYLTNLAMNLCIQRDGFNARRFALDGIYFSRNIRNCIRGLLILICPWFIRLVKKYRG